MASITVTGALIDIRFTGWERLFVGRARAAIPAGAVRHAARVAHPLHLARGGRRGIVVSGLLKIGIWGVFRGPRQLVVARRGEPGLHLVLDRAAAGGAFDEVVLSDSNAPVIAEAIRHAAAAGA